MFLEHTKPTLSFSEPYSVSVSSVILPVPALAVFYAVRLRHVPGIYTSSREAQPQTVGTLADVKRFSTRKKAGNYMACLMTLRHFFSPTVRPSPTAPQAGGYTSSSRAERTPERYEAQCPRLLKDPIGLVPGGPRACNTRELSANYHALDWIKKWLKSLDPAMSSCYKIVSDSNYCQKLFATRAIKPVANRHIISRPP